MLLEVLEVGVGLVAVLAVVADALVLALDVAFKVCLGLVVRGTLVALERPARVDPLVVSLEAFCRRKSLVALVARRGRRRPNDGR